MSAKKKAAPDRSGGKGKAKNGHGGAREGAGRKPFNPDTKQREKIELMIAVTPRIEDVAGALGIDVKTLREHCPDEIAHGKARRNSAVAESLFKMATEGKNVTAMIFWLKTQAGFKEVSKIEHVGNERTQTYEERMREIHEREKASA